MKVGIIGGSVAGLAAAYELGRLGADVHVFERSPGALQDRGAGIGLDPPALSYLRENGLLDAHVHFSRHAFVGGDDRVLWSTGGELASTCWDVLYRGLRAKLPERCYTGGIAMDGLADDGGKCVVSFADGRRDDFDLVVAADGADSRAREIFYPDRAPQFAGYIAVRGLIDEAALPTDALGEAWALYQSALVRYLVPRGHVIMYLVPGADGTAAAAEPGRRRLNWVWYVNVAAGVLDEALRDRSGRYRKLSVPPGMMAPERWQDYLAQGAQHFTGAFADVLRATERPFQQAVFSFLAPELVHGRACLIGDAGHLCRPHVGSGSSLAIADARRLAAALDASGGDVPKALAAWQAERLPAVTAMVDLSIAMGEAHQMTEMDWARMTPADFETWWTAMMAGKQIYFDPESGARYR